MLRGRGRVFENRLCLESAVSIWLWSVGQYQSEGESECDACMSILFRSKSKSAAVTLGSDASDAGDRSGK